MSVREQTLPIPSTSLGKCPAFEAEMVDVYASYLHSCSVKQFVLPNTGLNNPYSIVSPSNQTKAGQDAVVSYQN